jgi:hypothetical protein
VRRAALMLLCALSTGTAALAQGAATHSSNVWGVVFARNDSSVVTVARGEVRIWALPSGQLACRLDGDYYSGEVATDGESGYHITFERYDRGRKYPIRAIRIDGGTCAQTAAPLVAGVTGGYSPLRFIVTAPDGRRLPNGYATSPDSRLTIRSASKGYVVETPTGTRVESEGTPTALDAGTTWYACTATTKAKITYYRMTGTGRAEKIGEIDPNRYGMSACGPLSLSVDSTILLDGGEGSAIDLRRKRVLISEPTTTSTSMGIDVGAERMAIGFNGGVAVYDLKSRKMVSRYGGSSNLGYVSPSASRFAIASTLIQRPLVEVVSLRGGRGVTLDDTRSRSAADILMAGREAETRAREAADRREREREEAERARIRAEAEARLERVRRVVAATAGTPSVSNELRRRRYQDEYDSMRLSVQIGDLLLLVSESDGVVGYTLTDDEKVLSSESDPSKATTGFKISRSTMKLNMSGILRVQGRGAPVFVFLVRKADVQNP